MLKRLLYSGMIIALGVLLGRFSGFFREITLAYHFGIGIHTDIAVLLLTLPDLFINLLVSGACAAALIPAFHRVKSNMGSSLFIQASLIVLIAFIAIAGLIDLKPYTFIKLFAPGLSSNSATMAMHFLQISIWMLPFSALTGVSSAYLQSNQKFFIASLGTLIFNSVIIFSLTITHMSLLITLSYAIVAGAVLRWISQLLIIYPNLKNVTLWNTWLINRQLGQHYLQALLATGLVLIAPILARAFASFGAHGSIASLNFAIKLIAFPMAICLGIFETVLLPKLSELFSHNLKNNLAIELLNQSIQAATALSVIITMLLTVFAPLITKIIFHYGEMTISNILTIADLSRIGILALPAQGMSGILLACFNSRQDTKTPFIISTIAMSVFASSGYALYHWFALTGLMWGLVITYWLIMLLQLSYLKLKHQINLYKNLCSLQNSIVLAVNTLTIAPFYYCYQLQFNNIKISLLLLILAGGCLCLINSLLIKQFRAIIFSKLGVLFHA